MEFNFPATKKDTLCFSSIFHEFAKVNSSASHTVNLCKRRMNLCAQVAQGKPATQRGPAINACVDVLCILIQTNNHKASGNSNTDWLLNYTDYITSFQL